MPKAIWNNTVIAESAVIETIENNVYFPPAALRIANFQASATQTTCAWKGIASYYDVVVDGKVNKDAAWYYTDPKPAAKNIKDHVAFWKGVIVEQ